MNESLALQSLIFFFLIFARVAGLFVQAPIFASPHVTREVKIGLITSVSMLFFFLLPFTPPQLNPPDLFSLGAAMLRELFLGIVIGYVSFLPFAALQITGELIDTQMGLSTAMAFDPRLGMVNLTRRFLFYFIMVVFLMLNGHHVIIKAVYFSFKLIPPGNGLAVIHDNLYHFLTAKVSEIFLIALQYGLPALGAIFIGQVSLGVIARVAPQTNVFMISLPINFVLGVTFLGLSIPVIYHMLTGHLLDWNVYARTLDELIRVIVRP